MKIFARHADEIYTKEILGRLPHYFICHVHRLLIQEVWRLMVNKRNLFMLMPLALASKDNLNCMKSNFDANV